MGLTELFENGVHVSVTVGLPELREFGDYMIQKGIEKANIEGNKTGSISDRFGLDGLIKYLSEKEISITKASVYKFVHFGRIPYLKFNKQLVFDRIEIDRWIENTINSSRQQNVELDLAKSANRKRRS